MITHSFTFLYIHGGVLLRGGTNQDYVFLSLSSPLGPRCRPGHRSAQQMVVPGALSSGQRTYKGSSRQIEEPGKCLQYTASPRLPSGSVGACRVLISIPQTWDVNWWISHLSGPRLTTRGEHTQYRQTMWRAWWRLWKLSDIGAVAPGTCSLNLVRLVVHWAKISTFSIGFEQSQSLTAYG